MNARYDTLVDALLRVFPRPFRERYGDDMRDTFHARLRERDGLGRGRVLLFLLTTSADMLAAGLRERMRPSTPHRPGGRELASDVRLSIRVLRRSPGFVAGVVLTLGLGIGATTALFSVIEGVLLRPLPYEEPERIVQVWQVGAQGRMSFSEPNFRDVQARSRSIEAMAAYRIRATPVAVADEVVRVSAAVVSEDFFAVLGADPARGRRITPDEFSTDAAVVVVSDAFWRAYLDESAGLEGQTLRFGGRPYAVVGVMPPGVELPLGVDVWAPREARPGESRTAHNWEVVGRLRPGVDVEAASAELGGVARALEAEHGDDTWMVDAVAVPLLDQIVGWVRPTLLLLLGGAGLLLVVAVANVMNLMLARSASRRSEVAVRQAMGASRGWLARQSLLESLLLTSAGGTVGLLLAHYGVGALLALEPGRLPRAEAVGVNGWALAFAAGISFAAAAVLGLFDSARSARVDVREALAEAGRSGAGSVRLRRGRDALTVVQVAMAVVLLVGAGLLTRSFLALSAVDPGYRTSNILVADAFLPDGGGPDQLARIERIRAELVDRLAAMPGARAAGIASAFPLSGRGSNGQFLVLDDPNVLGNPNVPATMQAFMEAYGRLTLAAGPADLGYAEYRVASEPYFRALGIPLLAGRLPERSDGPDDPPVAVISESLAAQQWPDGDAIGRLVMYGNMDGDLRPYTIVGVVGDVRDRGLDAAPRPTFWGNADQRTLALRGGFSLVLAGDDERVSRLAPDVEAAARELAPEVSWRVRSIEEILSSSLSQRRFSLVLLAVFALTAVALAVSGIYGVIAYLVALRARDFAIRLALGAGRETVRGQVLARGLALGLVGVLAGTAIALVMTRLLDALLFGVEATDPLTFAAVGALLLLVALMASYVPAARATRVDPLVAMRE